MANGKHEQSYTDVEVVKAFGVTDAKILLWAKGYTVVVGKKDGKNVAYMVNNHDAKMTYPIRYEDVVREGKGRMNEND